MNTPTSFTTSFSTATLKLPLITSRICVIPCTSLLFTSSLLELKTQQKILYAELILSDGAFKTIISVTTNEIQAYLGFMTLMGVNHSLQLLEKVPCL